METQEQNDRYIGNLEKHIDRSQKSADYSIQRFDILIILVASGALVFSADYFNNNNILPDTDTILLRVSWISFGIAIILNLVSQLSGYYANKEEVRISRNLIRLERNKKPKGNQKIMESRKRKLNFYTSLFNFSSLMLLVFGIILMMIYII